MKKESQAHETLSAFIHEVGIPHEIHSDNAKALTLGEMARQLRKYKIYQTLSKPYNQSQNFAENRIKQLKNTARYFLQWKNSPIRLWSYAFVYAADILNCASSAYMSAGGKTPFEIVHGYTPDISEFVSFEWYELIWYIVPNEYQTQQLGRWCGVANNVGLSNVFYILKDKGIVITTSSVTHLTNEERSEERIKKAIKELDDSIEVKLGNYKKAVVNGNHINDDLPYLDFLKENDLDLQDTIEFQERLSDSTLFGMPKLNKSKYNDTLSKELQDKYVGIRVLLPRGDSMNEGVILNRKRTADGKLLVGKENNNPILDTCVYEVQFPDGGILEYNTNIIAESLYSLCDDDGYQYSLLKGIIDHRKTDEAISKEDGYVLVNGIRRKRISTIGWELQVTWEDRSTSWTTLKDLKESNPLEVAKYAISRDLENEPAFSWWVKHTLRTRDRIISRLKANKSVKRGMKFGIIVPTSISEAEELDIINGNNLWSEAINKEVSKVKVAFQPLAEGVSAPIGSKLIKYHMIFDVKFNLTQKARLVAAGYMNNVPAFTSYSPVVSRETVRICFMLAALNGLDIIMGDVGNTFIQAKPQEQCHVLIQEDYMFGPSAVGRITIIV